MIPLALLVSSIFAFDCSGGNLLSCTATLSQSRKDPRLLLKYQYLEDSLDACKLVGAIPRFACSFLTQIAEKAFSAGVTFALECGQAESCDQGPVQAVAKELDDLWLRYRETPLGVYLAPAYSKYVSLANNADISVVEYSVNLSMEICDEVRVFVYSTQRLNIMLHAFEKFPISALPHFRFSHLLGARWEVALELLSTENPVIAEIGVFRGFFSDYVLQAHPGLSLLGVDPYFGRDGTFPPQEDAAQDDWDPEHIYALAKSKY